MSGSFLLLLVAIVGAQVVRRRPLTLPVAIVSLALVFAGVLLAGPQAGLPLPFLDWREAWSLETVAAAGLGAWLLAGAAAPPRSSAAAPVLRLVVG